MTDEIANLPSIQRAEAAAKHFASTRRKLRASRFRYIDLDEAELLYSVPAGDGWVHVIGRPHDGSYEWVYVWNTYSVPDSLDIEHSDQGYGSADGAMLDGLKIARGED